MNAGWKESEAPQKYLMVAKGGNTNFASQLKCIIRMCAEWKTNDSDIMCNAIDWNGLKC